MASTASLPNRQSSLARADVLYLIGCGSYPIWWLLTPSEAYDPWWVWALLGLTVVSSGIAAIRFRPTHGLTHHRLFGFANVLHLHWLIAVNPGQMFYLEAAGAAAIASALSFNAWRPLAVFSVGVMALCIGMALEERSLIYYPVAIASGLGLANLRLLGATTSERRSAEREAALETQVAARTLDLAETNESLHEEQERRKRIQEELEVSQRMESVGRLAGGLAHDFNNELMTIQLYADLLAASLPAGQRARNDLDAIQRATEQAANLTRKLLTIGRSQPERVSGSVGDTVRDNADILMHLVGDRITLHTAIDTDSSTVPAGGDQLERILLNLVINAVDAMGGMEEDGTLTLRVDQLDPHEASDAALPSGALEVVRLTVSDTGPGIPEDVRSRIFDPYFTTKGTSERSGLGLSVVYSIVADSGGRVRVFSEPGEGTRFELLWPLEKAPASLSLPTVEPFQIERTRILGTSVLVVEDEADLRSGLARWLVEAGCKVQTAGTAEDALVLANTESFDVLATDVVLPGLSGTELVDRIREARPDTRVLIFSGNAEQHLGTRAVALPKDVHFLRKPFGASDFVHAVLG